MTQPYDQPGPSAASLRDYAAHKFACAKLSRETNDGCQVRLEPWLADKKPCTCGLDALLAAAVPGSARPPHQENEMQELEARVADERARIILKAKNHWLERAVAAEAHVRALTQDRDTALGVLASMDEWLGNSDGLMIEDVVEWRERLAALSPPERGEARGDAPRPPETLGEE